MADKDIVTHIRIVGWLHVLGASLVLSAGAVAFLFFAGIGLFSGDLKALGILGVIGLTGGVFMLLMALPGLLTGYGLLVRKPWARTLGIVVGILNLAAVPVGTIIGGYTLWILFEKDAERYFRTPA